MRYPRLAAVVDTTADGGLGTNWKPLQGIDDSTARAWAVWLNSTLGRIAMLRNRGNKLTFPVYRPSGMTTRGAVILMKQQRSRRSTRCTN